MQQIPGKENYLIDNTGNIKRLNHTIIRNNGSPMTLKEKILAKKVHTGGYLTTSIKGNHFFIHRLVAETFIPNPERKPQVNHKDGNKKNNHFSNLEWVTQNENMQHSYHVLKNRPEILKGLSGTQNGNAKINTIEKVKKIFELRKSDFSIKQIAKLMSVNKATISRILNKKTHSELTAEYHVDQKKIYPMESRVRLSNLATERMKGNNHALKLKQ